MTKRIRSLWPALVGGAALALVACSQAEEIGSVDTVFKFIGPDHKIVVEAFDDPLVAGVACYVSRAKTGGIKGAFGVAKDPSRFSVACRQVGPIRFAKPLVQQEEVFRESASFIFKHVRVVRMVDAKRNTLTYLTYSDKVIEGSPDNAITAVAVLDQKIPLKE
jgi:CreA protein